MCELLHKGSFSVNKSELKRQKMSIEINVANISMLEKKKSGEKIDEKLDIKSIILPFRT